MRRLSREKKPVLAASGDRILVRPRPRARQYRKAIACTARASVHRRRATSPDRCLYMALGLETSRCGAPNAAAARPPTRSASPAGLDIGVPLPQNEVKLAFHRPVNSWWRSPSVFMGYLTSRKTAERLRDGCPGTRDVGRIDMRAISTSLTA